MIDYNEERKNELRFLEAINRKQKAYKSGMIGGVFLILFGIFLAWFSVAPEIWVVPLIGLFVAAMPVVGYGFFLIWRGFIHSDWPIAIKIAGLFSGITLHDQKMEHVKRSIELEGILRRVEARKTNDEN